MSTSSSSSSRVSTPTVHDEEARDRVDIVTPQYVAVDDPLNKPPGSRNLRTASGAAGRTISRQQSIHLERALSRGVQPEKLTNWRAPWQVKVTPFEQILNQEYDGEGTEENQYLIDWIESDPENPMLMPKLAKWILAIFVSISTLAVALSSSAYSGALPSIEKEFAGHTTPEYTFGVSGFVLGFAVGPLVWGPLSELAGRRNLFVVTYAFLTLWTGVTIASPNLAAILVFRFLAGAFGSSPLTNAGGVLADTFSAETRGLALAVFASAPFLGPALGPITGGFLGEALGWRAVFIYLTIFSAVVFLIGTVFLPETYAPLLLRQRAAKLSKATGSHYLARVDKGKDIRISTQFKIGLSRPWKLLFLEPVVLLLSLYMSIIYAVLYSEFAAFPIVFQQERGWSPGIGGLAFIGILVGIVIALLFVIFVDNPRYVRISRSHKGIAPPEARLFSSMVGAPLLVVGLIWFAASTQRTTFWLVPIIGTAPFGAGIVLVFLSVQNYLIESYVIYASSVLAGNSLMRSLFGMAFPLFTPAMYHNLGTQWAASIPAFLAFACLWMPYAFYVYGARIRRKQKYSREAAELLALMMRSSKHFAAEEDGEKTEVASPISPDDDPEASPEAPKNTQPAPAARA